MNKSRNFAKKMAGEWRARGFKSSTSMTEVEQLDAMNPIGGNRNVGRFPSRGGRRSDFKQNNANFEQLGQPRNIRTRNNLEKTRNAHLSTVEEKGETKAQTLKNVTGQRGRNNLELKKKKIRAVQQKSEPGAADGQKQGNKPKRKKESPNEDGKETAPENGESVNTEGVKKQSKPKRRKQKFKGYVLFVGNLSYDTTKEDILNHFVKAGPIKGVRLPLGKEDNQPRGFAYLDIEDHITYEKCLSLHHSFLKRRRINVECTFGGSSKSHKRKALIKEKTLKLRFLSREGKISSAKKRPWGKFTKVDQPDKSDKP